MGTANESLIAVQNRIFIFSLLNYLATSLATSLLLLGWFTSSGANVLNFGGRFVQNIAKVQLLYSHLVSG